MGGPWFPRAIGSPRELSRWLSSIVAFRRNGFPVRASADSLVVFDLGTRMITPTVTAVIATYRPGEYLRQAIGSALTQTRPDLEILVSDDANDPKVARLRSHSVTRESATDRTPAAWAPRETTGPRSRRPGDDTSQF